MIIAGERVVLRPVGPSDFPYIVAWTNDEQVGHFTEDDGYPESLEECEQWYSELSSNRYNQVYMITINGGRPIGDIELDHIAWRSGDAEMRVRIGEPRFWNQGYGTDAVKALLRYSFEKLKLNRIYLRVSRSNGRAIRCYEKACFRKEGKLLRTDADGSREVVYLMRILKEEYFHGERAGGSGLRAG